MKRGSVKWAFALMVVLALVVPASGALAEDGSIEVVVSPYVLNLLSSGGSVSLHTDIAYGLVNLGSVVLTVNGEQVTPSAMGSDSRGQLVVKCDMDDIKETVRETMQVPGVAEFVLAVLGTDGASYVGEDTIDVISQSGVDRKA